METLKIAEATLQEQLRIIASVAFEANRQYCEMIGGKPYNPDWTQVEQDVRNGMVAAVKNTLDNPPMTLQESHDRWVKARVDAGWAHGPMLDAKRKKHPNIVDFASLPPQEQLKDLLFLSVVNGFGAFLGLFPVLEKPDLETKEVIPEGDLKVKGDLIVDGEIISKGNVTAMAGEEVKPDLPEGNGSLEAAAAGQDPDAELKDQAGNVINGDEEVPDPKPETEGDPGSGNVPTPGPTQPAKPPQDNSTSATKMEAEKAKKPAAKPKAKAKAKPKK